MFAPYITLNFEHSPDTISVTFMSADSDRMAARRGWKGIDEVSMNHARKFWVQRRRRSWMTQWCTRSTKGEKEVEKGFSQTLEKPDIVSLARLARISVTEEEVRSMTLYF